MPAGIKPSATGGCIKSGEKKRNMTIFMLPASNIKGVYPSNLLKSGAKYVSLYRDEIKLSR
jgi:hypothetical protein